jgi:hypothetical protein
MADLKTEVSIPGTLSSECGLALWGKLDRAEAVAALREHVERKLIVYTNASERLAKMTDAELVVEYMRGFKRVGEAP